MFIYVSCFVWPAENPYWCIWLFLVIGVKQNGMLLLFHKPCILLVVYIFFSVTGILGKNSFEKVLLLMYYRFLSPSDSSVKCLLSSAAMASTPPPLMKKHSQTDLVSRLKSRKVLGVGGEDDDGEVHRSKVTSHLPASVFIFDLNSSYSWKQAFFIHISYLILQYITRKGQI